MTPTQKEEKFVLSDGLQRECLDVIFRAFDMDGNGHLDLKEAKALMEAFQPDDKTAHISKKQRKKGVKSKKLKATENQVSKLFTALDADGSGKVDFHEFSDFMMS